MAEPKASDKAVKNGCLFENTVRHFIKFLQYTL